LGGFAISLSALQTSPFTQGRQERQNINRKDLKDSVASALGWVDEQESGPEMIFRRFVSCAKGGFLHIKTISDAPTLCA